MSTERLDRLTTTIEMDIARSGSEVGYRVEFPRGSGIFIPIEEKVAIKMREQTGERGRTSR